MTESSAVGPYGEVAELVFAGRPDRARFRLMEQAERSQNDPRWWVWMAASADSPMAGLSCLRNALRLDPADDLAQIGQAWIEGLIRRGEGQDGPEARGWQARPGLQPLRPDSPFGEADPQEDSDSDQTGEFPNLPKSMLARPESDEDATRLDGPRAPSILVVDDDDVVSGQVESSLVPIGYRVIRARESIEAIPLARKERPGLILVDTDMPRVDGYRVCKLLKSLEETREIPVILVAKNPLDLDHNRGRQAGCANILMTPLERDVLVREIELAFRPAV